MVRMKSFFWDSVCYPGQTLFSPDLPVDVPRFLRRGTTPPLFSKVLTLFSLWCVRFGYLQRDVLSSVHYHGMRVVSIASTSSSLCSYTPLTKRKRITLPFSLRIGRSAVGICVKRSILDCMCNSTPLGLVHFAPRNTLGSRF